MRIGMGMAMIQEHFVVSKALEDINHELPCLP